MQPLPSSIDLSPFEAKTSFFLISTYRSAVQTEQSHSAIKDLSRHFRKGDRVWSILMLGDAAFVLANDVLSTAATQHNMFNKCAELSPDFCCQTRISI